MADLRTSEIISLVYFLILAAMSSVRPASRQTRFAVWGAAWGVLVATAIVSFIRFPTIQLARDWLPAALLLLAYWTPSRLITVANPRFEQWLLRIDRAVLSSKPGATIFDPAPAVRELLELSYLLVYPLIPFAFALLVAHGLRFEADWFWTVVLSAEYLCYGLLPFLPARPPRAVEPAIAGAPGSKVRAVNLWILGRASNQWNTFPSGHVAGSVACALVVVQLLPIAGVALLLVATGIAVGSVAGRYHYVLDALAGIAVAVAAFTIAAASRA